MTVNVSDSAPPVPLPDFTAVKSRKQATWASGDFAIVAARIVFQAEHLCEAADLQAGWRVLDVATGSGNAALAAARPVGRSGSPRCALREHRRLRDQPPPHGRVQLPQRRGERGLFPHLLRSDVA